MVRKIASITSRSEELLCVRLSISDLVDDEANTALGDDVRHAVANLDGHNRLGGIDSEHWEEVHNWVCAPADDGHHLSHLDLALDGWVRLQLSCSGQANQQLVHNVQEEEHGHKPAHPAWGQITGDSQLSVVATDDHECRTNTQGLCLLIVHLRLQLHHQQDLDQQQRHGQEPIHVTVGIVEWHTGQDWVLDGSVGTN